MADIAFKLGTTERKKHFRSKQSLEQFFQDEQIFWQEFFNDKIPTNHALQTALNRIHSNVLQEFTQVQSILNTVNEDLVNIETPQTQLEQKYLNRQLLYSKSAFSKFLQENPNPVLSIFILGSYINNAYKEIMFDSYGNIHQQLKNFAQQTIQYMSEATTQKTLFEYGLMSNIEAEKSALSEIKEEWGVLIGQGERDLQNINSNFTSEQENIQFCQQKSKQHFRILTEKFNRFINKSKQEMQEFEAFYEKELAMKSAVKYWRDKKHASLWIAGALALFIGIIGFQSIKYLFTISETIGRTLLDYNTSAVQNGINQSIHYMPILHFAIISMFLVWFLRIAVKIFLSKLHHAETASEREMFIKSYLALMNEEKGSIVDDQDRQLILQSIFRPANDGIVNEEGPKMTDLFNLINRGKNQS